MNMLWPNLQSLYWPKESIGEKIGTLVSHDFDLIILIKRDDRFRIQYLADVDEENFVLRYIVFEIDKMDLRAMLTSSYPLYNCLHFPPVAIFDENYTNKNITFYQSEGVAIPEECLPEKNALLPSIDERFIKLVMGFEPASCCIVVDGQLVEKNTISFQDYAKILSAVQRVSTECTEFKISDKILPFNPGLRVVAQKAASFAIQIEAEDYNAVNILGKTLNELTNLFLNGSKSEIHDVLDKLPTTLARSLFSLYNLSMSGNSKIIYKFESQYIYIDHERSNKIRLNINDAGYIRDEEIVALGYLVGANLKTNYFYFENAETEEKYRGRFSEQFLEMIGQITIDEQTVRWATFSSTTEFNFNKISQKYVLLKLEEPT